MSNGHVGCRFDRLCRLDQRMIRALSGFSSLFGREWNLTQMHGSSSGCDLLEETYMNKSFELALFNTALLFLHYLCR